MQILYIDTRDLTESGAASVSSGAYSMFNLYTYVILQVA